LLWLLVGCGVPEQTPGNISPPSTGTAARSAPTTNHESLTSTAMPTALIAAQSTLVAPTTEAPVTEPPTSPPPTITPSGALPLSTTSSDHTALPIILSPAAEAPGGARLVFSSIHEGNMDLYLVNADGSQLTRLTHMPGSDRAPL
jgi:hypothetical protein